tara:strand:- start:66 stop:275 length:210 start_codon:yes stop_codon:yes gene_type:complete
MYLKDYRNLKNYSYKKLANELGISSGVEVMYYCKGQRFPSLKNLINIETKTNGAVTANDFVKYVREHCA